MEGWGEDTERLSYSDFLVSQFGEEDPTVRCRVGMVDTSLWAAHSLVVGRSNNDGIFFCSCCGNYHHDV